MKTVKLYTLGCKVNQYDTQLIREQFLNAGFRESGNSFPADIYVINTCTVTQRADADSLNLARKAKRENPAAKIVITGCLTELDSQRIFCQTDAGLIVKNRDKNRILDLLSEPMQEHAKVKGNQRPDRISYFRGHTRAFLKIQDGCNNFCSYCKVPLVRGRPRSKPLNLIIEEAGGLVKSGFKEIVLCGICLGAYGKDFAPAVNLIDVIEELEKIDGLLRIRLSSIEAFDISDELIERMAQSGKLCRHLHIPLQSGDDKVLKMMNRKYTQRDYLSLIQKIRSYIPQVCVTTDILAGFPGESEENFMNTVKLIKEILPLKVHVFAYSRRKGTPAADFKDMVSAKVIKERINYLKNIIEDCAFKYKNQFLHKEMNVLIERRVKENPIFWEGYADNYIRVMVESGRDLRNRLIYVRLDRIITDYMLATERESRS